MTRNPFENELLWTPTGDPTRSSRLDRFLDWAAERGIKTGNGYHEVWQWSVFEPGAFWGAVRDHFELPIHGEETILDLGSESSRGLPGARWFPGSSLNAAEVMLGASGRADNDVALISHSQTRPAIQVSFGELRSEVARVRRGLGALGVQRGDRVAAYAPNIPETVIAFLAVASLGAIWTSCAPEFGTRSVLDRLTQTKPKVLFTIDGYRYGTRVVDRRAEVAEIVDSLESLTQVVSIRYLDREGHDGPSTISFELLDGPTDPGCTRVAFDHPLWILYSSGTTGLPKPIVHGHGGITLEHHKALALQSDIGTSDRFFWFTTTGWMMWNYLVSGLSVGATLVLFDGDPGSPDLTSLWRLAEDTGITAFGVSAPFVDACRQAQLQPGRDFDLSRLRWFGSTGAPLDAAGFRWIDREVGRIPISSISGGTDVCTAFVGGAPSVAVRAGVISCRFLGADVHAFDDEGNSVTDQEGELVVTTPMPSMPVALWGDLDGSRLRAAYFEHFRDTWWHGDWITVNAAGECVISGRSDATLNRGGVRLGTADFYSVIADLDGITDCLVVHLNAPGTDELIAFIVTDPGVPLDDTMESMIKRELRTQLSPRHVPDVIASVPAVPRTLSGKKTEVPVKRILGGASVSEALATGALANPESIEPFVAWYRDHR